MATGLVQDQVVEELTAALDRAKESGAFGTVSIPKFGVEPPKREEWGDLSSNVALTLAPMVRRPPLEVAGLIVQQLKEVPSDLFERIDVAPPGFLNFTIKPNRWLDVLREIEKQGPSYGKSRLGEGQRVMVEFVSANPTGPLHVGHGRGAALGHAISNLLEATGFSVQREYYVNDAGRQLKLLGSSVFARYQEHFGQSVSFPEDGYRGSYIQAIARDIAQKLGPCLLERSTSDAESQCTELAYHELLEQIKKDLEAFGVRFDSWYSEANLLSSGLLEQALDQLKQDRLLFQKDGAWWFRSSDFQDEKDRVVAKQDGEYTYLASDIAYHRHKLEQGFHTLVNIWGADHHGYVARMQAAIQAFGYPKERLRVVLVQMVSLLRGGKKVEMSKRAGEFVTLRNVIDEVGPDAAKFFFLMRRADTHLDFDLELAKQQSAENPLYYVQYAHARLSSLFRVAQERGFTVPSIHDVDHALLVGQDELRLIRHVSSFPSLVEGSAVALEPHRVTFYLQELASHLHTYYYKHRVLPPLEGTQHTGDNGDTFAPLPSRSKEKEQPEVGKESVTPDLTTARLALMRQIQTVFHNGLTLLGVSSPDRM